MSQGLVVIPTDSATAAQKERYAAYVAARTPRTVGPQGPARMLFAPDLLGTSQQIAEALYAHAGFQAVTEVAFALPFDFAEIQRSHVRAFRAAHPDGAAARVSQGLVVIPTDSASADQRERYAAYAAARTPRTAAPQGPARLLFARDMVGTSEQIAEQLYAHAGFQEVTEVVFALPFSFTDADYEQILTDIATTLGPALGWRAAG